MIFISKTNVFHCMRPIKKCIFFLEIKRDSVPRRNILFPGSFFFLYRKKYQTLNGPFQITSRFEDHASNNTFQVLFSFFFDELVHFPSVFDTIGGWFLRVSLYPWQPLHFDSVPAASFSDFVHFHSAFFSTSSFPCIFRLLSSIPIEQVPI